MTEHEHKWEPLGIVTSWSTAFNTSQKCDCGLYRAYTHSGFWVIGTPGKWRTQ